MQNRFKNIDPDPVMRILLLHWLIAILKNDVILFFLKKILDLKKPKRRKKVEPRPCVYIYRIAM